MILKIILKVQRNKRNAVICYIEKKRRYFPRIQNIKKYESRYIIVSYTRNYTLNDKQKNSLIDKYRQLSNVDNVTIDQTDHDIHQNISAKNFHFVFDVDSTLTTGRGTIQSKVRNIFRRMKESGHRVYLASGRNETQLRQDMGDFDTERFGIAENGGILIGMGDNGHLVIGDRAESDKVLNYMKQTAAP